MNKYSKYKMFNLFFAVAITLLWTVMAHANLTVVTWGGSYSESQKKAYGDTWSGGNVKFVSYNGFGMKLKEILEANPEWDVIDVLSMDLRVGCMQGLFEKIPFDTFSKAPNGDGILEDVKKVYSISGTECGVPLIFWSYAPFYDTKVYPGRKLSNLFMGKSAPKTVNDFFDTKKFPGKRAIHGWPMATMEMALVADGVNLKDVYKVLGTDEGIDRAFKKLDSIKKDLVVWYNGEKPIELVLKEGVVMSIAYNGRVFASNQEKGTKLKIIWDGSVIESEYYVIRKGSKNYKAALDFVKHASSTESLARQAKYINYGPMRASSMDIIKKGEPWYQTGIDILPHLPNTEERLKMAVKANPDFWMKNYGKIGPRFKAWLKE